MLEVHRETLEFCFCSFFRLRIVQAFVVTTRFKRICSLFLIFFLELDLSDVTLYRCVCSIICVVLSIPSEELLTIL